jgi:phasin family protein
MAGKNPNGSNKAAEAPPAAVREAASQTEDAARTGIESMRRVTEEFSRTFGLTSQNEEVARQATRNLEAITETNAILLRGFQEVSREWVELAQQRLQSHAEALTKLANCRTLPDLAAVQSEIVRENLHQMIDNTRKIAEHSVQVAQEAAQSITAKATGAAERLRRAA